MLHLVRVVVRTVLVGGWNGVVIVVCGSGTSQVGIVIAVVEVD